LSNLYGSAGTVFTKAASQQRGTLVYDNNDKDAGAATPVYSLQASASTALTANSLSDETASFVPGTLIGLELNPNLQQGRTFTVVAHDATTLQTDPADGDMRTVAAVGSSYGGEPALDVLEIANHARVEVLDGNANRPDRRGLLTTTDLDILDTSRLEHPVANATSFFGLEVDVTDTLTVDDSSRIEASARGFLGAFAPGNNAFTGRTLGNVAGSTSRNGGSYGGLGGIGSAGGTVNAVYGDSRDPNEPGSGGGSDSGVGGNGGGLIRINAGSIELGGVIAADGSDGLGDRAAGGSGGAIRIDVGTLSGAGTIHASGGPGDDQLDAAGGGGGGRVAVFFGTNNGFPAGNVQAQGGTGRPGGDGAAGSVVLE
jgi:hypothetical protein